MRMVAWLFSLTIVVLGVSGCGSGSGVNACERAGGTCSPTTPGACLHQVAGDPSQYGCDGPREVCCLPLSESGCERAGGLCVNDPSVDCANGVVGDPSTYPCANGGSPQACCLPSADAGS